MRSLELELFADYFQFLLQDDDASGDLSDAWSHQATDRMLAVAPGIVGVGTVRNMTVPVLVELHESPPPLDAAEWDHVTQCSLDVRSGRIVVAGCTDYFPDAWRISVPPGCYQVRVSYGGLSTVSSNRLDGEDHYRVQLWPGEPGEPVILKAHAVHGVSSR